MRALAISVLLLVACTKRDAPTGTTTTTSADLDAWAPSAAADTTSPGESIPGGTQVRADGGK